MPNDVPAGRYEAHSNSTDCDWEIDKTASQDIVDNDIGKLGHLVVTLKSGVAIFASVAQGCKVARASPGSPED